MNVQLVDIPEKKVAIFESTLKLVRDYGFHGTPMSQIAKESDVATGTIYHYFSSKDELIIELLYYCKNKLHRAIFADDEDNIPYEKRLANIWRNLVQFYVENPAFLSFLEQFYSSPFAKQMKSNETICFQDEIAKFLKYGITHNHVKDIDDNVISAAFIGTAISVAKRTINGTFVFQEEHLANMLSILSDGIIKHP